jgi:putative nucleotidyltransferase with HDIG domain
MNELIQIENKKSRRKLVPKEALAGTGFEKQIINTLVNIFFCRKQNKEWHSYRVSRLCSYMGEALGLRNLMVQDLIIAGMLHDIGKICIKEEILKKPGRLTMEEWDEIKRHPEIGYRILSQVNGIKEIIDCVLSHHERWDGKGYPKGLREKEIPLAARIVAIADAYDAMTCERTYREVFSKEIALEELQHNAGTQFDPYLVKVFVEMMQELR